MTEKFLSGLSGTNLLNFQQYIIPFKANTEEIRNFIFCFAALFYFVVVFSCLIAHIVCSVNLNQTKVKLTIGYDSRQKATKQNYSPKHNLLTSREHLIKT